jgi:hypothetical protein
VNEGNDGKNGKVDALGAFRVENPEPPHAAIHDTGRSEHSLCPPSACARSTQSTLIRSTREGLLLEAFQQTLRKLLILQALVLGTTSIKWV